MTLFRAQLCALEFVCRDAEYFIIYSVGYLSIFLYLWIVLSGVYATWKWLSFVGNWKENSDRPYCCAGIYFLICLHRTVGSISNYGELCTDIFCLIRLHWWFVISFKKIQANICMHISVVCGSIPWFKANKLKMYCKVLGEVLLCFSMLVRVLVINRIIFDECIIRVCCKISVISI